MKNNFKILTNNIEGKETESFKYYFASIFFFNVYM